MKNRKDNKRKVRIMTSIWMKFEFESQKIMRKKFKVIFVLQMSRLYLALLENHYKHLWDWIKLGILLSTLDKVKSLTDDCYETSKCFYDSLAVARVFIRIYQLEWFPYWCGQFPALIFVQICNMLTSKPIIKIVVRLVLILKSIIAIAKWIEIYFEWYFAKLHF